MDVAAHHAFNGIRLRIVDGSFFEVTNEVEDILDAAFYISAERPITASYQASSQIDGAVAPQHKGVSNIANVPQPAQVMNQHRVKLVPYGTLGCADRPLSCASRFSVP
jgi:hypothetical protein